MPALLAVTDLLAEARSSLSRLSPEDAAAAARNGALLVDIRPHAHRLEHGEVPGALVVERTSLEFALDPTSDSRLPVASHDLEVVLLCGRGEASSLAAAALQRLGVTRATDVIGGFAAWRSAGLPVVAGGSPPGARSGSAAAAVTVDAARGEVRVEGRPVAVTAKQLRLLDALQRAQGRIVTRTALAQAAGIDPSSDRSVDVLVCRLRQRLGPVGARRLVTVRGSGFRLLM